jgi:hypothetical protein
MKKKINIWWYHVQKKYHNILIHLFLARGNGTGKFFILKLIFQGIPQLYTKDPYH